MRTDAEFDHVRFQDYVVNYAKAAGIDGRYALAQATGINRSSLSKWYTGEEQPSIPSLRKLAVAIHAPLRELQVLAGHMGREEIDADPVAPVLPAVHPRAAELAKMLADDSPLTAARREILDMLADNVMALFRAEMSVSRGRRKVS